MSSPTPGKSIPHQWVIDEQGRPTAVIITIEEYGVMQERLGEIATREEEASPKAMRLLSQAEADIAAVRLAPHANVMKRRRSRRGRKR